jgi:hypothetical protein
MTSRIVTVAALACVVVAAPGWCAGAATPARDNVNHKFYAQLGRFEPTAGGLDGHTALGITYSWHRASYYATVEYVESSHTEIIEGTPVEAADQGYMAVGGVRLWQSKWYYGAGIGVATVRHDLNTPLGTLADSDTEFAWEVVAGAPFGKHGLAEIKYLSAGESAVRGFAAFVGVTY